MTSFQDLFTELDISTLTDLGYENAGPGFRHPVKKPGAVNSPSPTRRSTA